MPKKSRPLNPEEFDAIDWDPVEAENSNLAKCMKRGIDELVVWEVFAGDWVNIEMPVDTAEFVIVGPNEEGTPACGPCFSPRPRSVAIGSAR